MKTTIKLIFLTYFLLIFSTCSVKKPIKTTNFVEKPDWVRSQIYDYKPSKKKEIDILHTLLKVDFDWKNKTMNGEATITLKPFLNPIDTITLDAKSFILKEIKLSNTKIKDSLKYYYDQKKIKITLNRKISAKDTLEIYIKYVAQPEVYAKDSSLKGTAITNDKGLYFITPDSLFPNKPYQIWTQGEPESNSCWFPTIEAMNDKFTQEIYITVSKKMKTLSNGELMYSLDNQDSTRTDYWKQTLPHSAYLAMIAVGDFEIIKDKYKKLEVNYYVEKSHKSYAKKIFGNTPEMIQFFENKLNYSYPWDKYSSIVVRDYVSGAMENTSATVFMEQVQRTDRELLDQNYENILAHELFHHWFGDLVTCESWANLPLNESFADYSEYLWEEYKYGKEAADYAKQNSLEQYLWESRSKREPLIRYNHRDTEDMFDSHSYAKGGTVLHALRNYVGDAIFYKSLNFYLTKNAFKSAEIHDLRLAFEEISGEDLNWFFDQWFFKLGHPEINVKHSFENNKLTLKISQNQDTKYQPIYTLPIEITYYLDTQKVIKNIFITKKESEFEFDCFQKPKAIIFDSKDIITGIITHSKTIKELVNQYYVAPNYISKYECMEDLKSKLDSSEVLEMYKSATKDSFWKIREMALETLSYAPKKDSLVINQLYLNCYDKEKKSSVRATVLEKLANLKQKKYSPMFVYAMNDSSYQVAGAALAAFIKVNPDSAESKIKIFENEKNIEIILTLADYYAKKSDSTHFDWFKQKINENKGNGLYTLTTEFGNYGMKVSKSVRKNIADFLMFQAENEKSPWGRYAAVQGLVKLDILDKSYKPFLDKIKKNEKHERLKKLYEDLL